MLYLALKAAISGILIALASEVARRTPTIGALITSLPLVVILAMIWLWRDKPDASNMADYASATFWYVLTSLPMFLLVSWLLRKDFNFWIALVLGCALTMVLFGMLLSVGPRFGLRL